MDTNGHHGEKIDRSSKTYLSLQRFFFICEISIKMITGIRESINSDNLHLSQLVCFGWMIDEIIPNNNVNCFGVNENAPVCMTCQRFRDVIT